MTAPVPERLMRLAMRKVLQHREYPDEHAIEMALRVALADLREQVQALPILPRDARVGTGPYFWVRRDEVLALLDRGES